MHLKVLFVIVALGACGDDSEEGSAADADSAADSQGGDTAGGDTGSADTGVADTGVADSGAQDTGVADTGISDTGVADTGVDDTGVADTGDTDTGGEDTGVADTADTVDTADTADTTPDDTVQDTDAGDTAAPACVGPEDCTLCTFGSKITTPDECYCLFCPYAPMTASECQANQDAWNQHCDPWPKPEICPVASCLPGAPPICDDGVCAADPNGCFSPEDCGTCRFAAPPEAPEDCQCPGCPTPLAITYCEAIETAVADVCAGFDFDSCLPPPCAFPPPIICTDARTCGYGDFGPER